MEGIRTVRQYLPRMPIAIEKDDDPIGMRVEAAFTSKIAPDQAGMLQKLQWG